MARDDMLTSLNGNPGNGIHPTAVEAEGLSIFNGNKRGGFEVRMLGYDRAQVEQHIRQLERALAYTRAMNRQLDKQVAQLRRRLTAGDPLRLPVPLSEPASETASTAGDGADTPGDGASA